MFEKLIKDTLVWLPGKGIGYYPVKNPIYNGNYFDKYKGYANTEIGYKINQARVAFVSKYFSGKVLDVGIGCGQFVMSRKDTFGYDINPTGISFLEEHNMYADLYRKNKFDAICFWDSLEHIKEPEKAIKQAKKYVFVSIPIFRNVNHIMDSKHFRRDEHYWYFTHMGLIRWFSENGFSLVEVTNQEEVLKREDIKTYAFRRTTSD